MTKFSPPSRAKSNLRTSLRVPPAMLKLINEDMARSGFNRKQRSQWLQAVIHDLLARPDFSNLVAEEFIMPGATESIPVSLNEELVAAIASAVAQVEQEEGIKKDRSALIRTAITQRFMARSGMQLSPVETAASGNQTEADT